VDAWLQREPVSPSPSPRESWAASDLLPQDLQGSVRGAEREETLAEAGRCGRAGFTMRRLRCWHAMEARTEGGIHGGDGGRGAVSLEAESARRTDVRCVTGKGSTPGQMTRGFLPRGKQRDVGCNPASSGLPKGVAD